MARPSGSRSQLCRFRVTSSTHTAWGRGEDEGASAPLQRPAPSSAQYSQGSAGWGAAPGKAPARPGGPVPTGGLGAPRVRRPAEAGQQPRGATHGVVGRPRRLLVPREAGGRQQQAQRQGGGHHYRKPGHGDAGGGGARNSSTGALYLRLGGARCEGGRRDAGASPSQREKPHGVSAYWAQGRAGGTDGRELGGDAPFSPTPAHLPVSDPACSYWEAAPRPLPPTLVPPGSGLSGSGGSSAALNPQPVRWRPSPESPPEVPSTHEAGERATGCTVPRGQTSSSHPKGELTRGQGLLEEAGKSGRAWGQKSVSTTGLVLRADGRTGRMAHRSDEGKPGESICKGRCCDPVPPWRRES